MPHMEKSGGKSGVQPQVPAPITPVQAAPIDPRDPDHSRTGIFVYHNCAYCSDGEKACKQGNPSQCEYPHARND